MRASSASTSLHTHHALLVPFMPPCMLRPGICLPARLPTGAAPGQRPAGVPGSGELRPPARGAAERGFLPHLAGRRRPPGRQRQGGQAQGGWVESRKGARHGELTSCEIAAGYAASEKAAAPLSAATMCSRRWCCVAAPACPRKPSSGCARQSLAHDLFPQVYHASSLLCPLHACSRLLWAFLHCKLVNCTNKA